jgi:hypothetical protein
MGLLQNNQVILKKLISVPIQWLPTNRTPKISCQPGQENKQTNNQSAS